MTPTPPSEREAQARLIILLTVRAMGVIAMLVGLGVWLGGYQGHGGLGTAAFLLGAFCSFLLPALLARLWRSPKP
ncbi:hypothetical protein [Sphingomonas quercus]|uniref:Uncharacterized protein n=1 Tax=Sphingomonas quercus TaxID=2842451 RepID=A0ABS6BI38_9SPHN|nr:hypothetical protein [Sphingomonas quercus]MBU3077973.1 hypothetical protein [Sphingomonas quercus]